LSSHGDDEEPDELPDPWYARIVFEDEHSTPKANFRWFVLYKHWSETKLEKVFVHVYMGAKPKLGRFCLHIHGSETKLGKLFVYIHMGAKRSLGGFCPCIHGGWL
jgi:hypothetical protein